MSRYIAKVGRILGSLFSLPTASLTVMDEELDKYRDEDSILCGYFALLDVPDNGLFFSTKIALDGVRKNGELARLLQCHIERLEQHKVPVGLAQHEFLFAYMKASGRSPDRSYRRVLCISRNIDESRRISSSGSDSFKSSSDKSRVIKGDPRPPLDSVQVLMADNLRGATLVYSLDFSPYSQHGDQPYQGPTLIDVVCLAQTISDIAPEYQLYKFSCYWYARMFCDTMELLFSNAKPKEYDDNPRVQRGKYFGIFTSGVNSHGQLVLPPAKASNTRQPATEDLIDNPPEDLLHKQRSPAQEIPPESKPFIQKGANEGPPEVSPAKFVKGRYEITRKSVMKNLQDPDKNTHCRKQREEDERVAAERAKVAAERAKVVAERAKVVAERAKVVAEQAKVAERDAQLEAERVKSAEKDAEIQRLTSLLAQSTSVRA